MAPVSLSLTVNRMHSHSDANIVSFQHVHYSLKASRLQIFKQDDFSLVRKNKTGQICMFIEQNEHGEAHHIGKKQPSYFELCMQPRRPLCEFVFCFDKNWL